MDAPKPPHPHAAAHFGVAAVATAGVLLLMAVPALHLAYILQATNHAGFDPADLRRAAYGGYAGAALALVLGLTAVVTGVRGCYTADRTGEPKVLCDTGIYLGLFATAVWVGCAVAWHSQAWRFVRPG